MKEFLLGLFFCGGMVEGSGQAPELPVCRNKMVVIAHRGDHTRAPENSVAGVRDAIECGVDYVEIDLRTTKDGHLVLRHDGSVKGKGNVRDIGLAELRGVEPQTAEFGEVLRLCKGRMNIYLDFKEANVAEAWRQVKEAGMERQIVVYLNKPEQYGQWKTVAGQMPLMTSLPAEVKTEEEVEKFLTQTRVQVLDNVYGSRLLEWVRKRGVAVWLDVEDKDEGPEVWERMITMGVEGLQTDHPEEMMAYLRKKGVVGSKSEQEGNREMKVAAGLAGYYNVKDFGAVGDGKSLESGAINKAIEAAEVAGGGTVVVPAGNYLCGSIRLKSKINLLIDQGAVVIAAEVKEENGYDEEEPGSSNGYQDYGHSHWHNSLIWGEDLHDVSITGGGLIRGDGLYKGGVKNKSKQSANKAIALLRCRNVLIRDISILHGGWFAILATGTDNLTLDNVKMDTNRDGVDVDACRNVRISNCFVNSPYDDAICLKSTYALGYARSTDNVTITNCQVTGYDEGTLLDGTYKRTDNPRYHFKPTGRIKMGTESNGGFRNITISNCVLEYCQGLVLETVDGASLEEVTIDNITMRDMVEEPIFLRLGARMRGPKETPVGVFRRINISNILVYNSNAENTCTISGIPGHSIEDVQLSNIRVYYQGGGKDTLRTAVPEKVDKYPEPGMFGDNPVYGLYVRHVKNITLSDVLFYYMKPDERSPMEFDEVDGLYLRHAEGQREKGVKPMILKGVRRLRMVK